MDISSRLGAVETERLLFGVGAVVTGAMTLLVFYAGDETQGALFGAFSLYLGGAATPAIRDNVTDYRRTGAIVLGGFGIAAIVLGVQSPLPMLFVIGGIAAIMNLF